VTLADGIRDRYVAAYDRVTGSGRRRPAWMRRLRDEALARFLESGFPGVKHEDWKYTSLAALEAGEYDPAPQGGVVPPDEVARYHAGGEGHVLVFVDGRYRRELSTQRDLPHGAHLGSLADALSGEIDGLVPYFIRTPLNAFTDLNTMLTEDGAFIHLGKNVEVTEPVHLLFLASESGRPAMCHPRNLVIAGENSRIRIVERYAGGGDTGYFTNAMTDIVAGRNASVSHTRIQEESAEACHVATLRSRQGEGSRFAGHSASFGSSLSRYDIHAVLDGVGADCLLNGLYLGKGRQHVDHFITVDHAKPSGASREYFHGVLGDNARGVFRGRVIVRRDAQGTDARQSNRNLLLSRESEADSRPQLEIHADDVKCTHGATVGPLDEEKVFYLRSRGIDEGSAKGLLAWAFAAEILRRFDLPGVRRDMEAKLLSWLPDTHRIREFLHETG
jgi:Fe-S cluster assembly protein SufD